MLSDGPESGGLFPLVEVLSASLPSRSLNLVTFCPSFVDVHGRMLNYSGFVQQVFMLFKVARTKFGHPVYVLTTKQKSLKPERKDAQGLVRIVPSKRPSIHSIATDTL